MSVKSRGNFLRPLRLRGSWLGWHPSGPKGSVCLTGAGAGMLTCAVCEHAAKSKRLKEIHIDAYEKDKKLCELLEESLESTKKWLGKRRIDFSYRLISEDFILANTRTLWKKQLSVYDLAVGNPPYFKIGKNDPRANANLDLVYGQPNIYALFMGVTSELLREKGVMIFITPRSFAAGPYFKAFRKRFFSNMKPERVHIFESRKDTFRTEEVLQENVILLARKRGSAETMGISVSEGSRDLPKTKIHKIPVVRALHNLNKGDTIFRLPTSFEESTILETVDSWRGTLHKYGCEISTGPVVPFRAKDLIPEYGGNTEGTVPLLWMQHV